VGCGKIDSGTRRIDLNQEREGDFHQGGVISATSWRDVPSGVSTKKALQAVTRYLQFDCFWSHETEGHEKVCQPPH
jgi:hypothetical protein